MSAQSTADYGPDRSGPSSLTELLDTDALLDALACRLAPGAEGAVAPVASADQAASFRADLVADPDDLVIRLLAALAADVDRDLPTVVDPIATAALAAGYDEVTRLAEGPAARDGDLGAAAESDRPARDRRMLFLAAQRTIPRNRSHQWIAAGATAFFMAMGGGWAAAATNDPDHVWGPLRPVSKALHPGWEANSPSARRAAVVRGLDKASQQSRAGQRVQAAATFGAAAQQATELPKGPDPELKARIDAVAKQIGVTPDATGTSPGGLTEPTSTGSLVDPTGDAASGSTGSDGGTGVGGVGGQLGDQLGNPTIGSGGLSAPGSAGTATDPAAGDTAPGSSGSDPSGSDSGSASTGSTASGSDASGSGDGSTAGSTTSGDQSGSADDGAAHEGDGTGGAGSTGDAGGPGSSADPTSSTGGSGGSGDSGGAGSTGSTGSAGDAGASSSGSAAADSGAGAAVAAVAASAASSVAADGAAAAAASSGSVSAESSSASVSASDSAAAGAAADSAVQAATSAAQTDSAAG